MMFGHMTLNYSTIYYTSIKCSHYDIRYSRTVSITKVKCPLQQ